MTAQPSISRFQVVERPTALPAKCAVCGGGNRPSVDFGVNVRNYGAVYFCDECIGEAARQFGFVSPGELVASKVGAEQSAIKYLSENNLVAIDRGFYDSIVDAVRSLYDDISVLRPVLSLQDDAESAQESTGDTETSSDNSNSEQPASGQKPRASSKRRSSSVPVNPSDELGFDLPT